MTRLSSRWPASLVSALLSLSPLACNTAPPPAANTSTETSGDGDGDPGDGDGDGDGDPGDGDGDGEAIVDWPTLDCDPLVPELCGFPFPNNVFSEADPSTPTGRRLALSQALMPKSSYAPDPSGFNTSDGFSPSSTIMTFMPGGTTTGLATPVTIASSLGPDSPTILIDTSTGARVPHWAEYDVSHTDDSRRAFMIRPAVRLEPDTRYIVAIRQVVDQAGVPLPASEGFVALRDGTPSDEPSIEQRRPLYLDIFARLADAGIERETLQLAWDFSTASDENVTGSAVHLVDEGLALIGPDGPDYVIDQVTLDPTPGIAMRIELTMTVPLFLDDPGGGGSMVYGDDGLPEASGTAEYPVLIHVPTTAADSPARLMAYGHGMLGSRWEITADHLEALAADHNVIVFATDWVGMAEDDVDNIVQLLSTGHIDDFHTVPDRLQQGFFNAFAAMRLIQGKLADDPIMQGVGGSMVDPVDPWYFGGSQGGIFGSCYMALSPDVTRGVLAVPGQPYSLLLNRSVNFSQFFTLINTVYPDKLDLRLFVELVQLQWDRAEPSGFTRHIIEDPLPGSYEKDVLLLVSIGDHQVTTLGAHMMARELGVPQIGPANRPDLFEIDVVEQPYAGSAMIEYGWGLGPEPIENVPMTEGEDPHGKLADIPIAVITVEQFLRTGVVESFCDDVCDPI
ncbi:hypothetical protein [Enhygromyxa salina]|uniref:hypothetical protein n=1 Tax=Enhygromyxa salina TaxID=215803 RepID=UPI001FD3787F|nr:hypothetical protein [Enhygromyxa salina]